MNKGLKAYTTLIQHNLGNNFTTYVNLNKEDANMHVIVPLLSTSGINGFHTSLIFNLLDKDQKGIFGKGFKLNFYSRLDDLETKIIIKNADGSIDEFLKENNYYNKEVCAKITKVVDSSSVTGYHYELIFNDNTVKYYRSNEEYPYMIKDSKNNILFIEYMLNGDLLIKNELNDEIHFKLVNDGYVSHVKYYQDGEVISTVELRYYDEKLDSIGYFINNVTKTNSMINYSSEYIELIKDDGKNLLKLVFEEGKVKQIFKGKNQIYKDTPLNTIIYHDEYTELINSKSEKNYYFFDNNNLLLYVLDYNGKIFKVKHDLYSKKIIKRSSILPVVNKTQNLLPSNDIRNFENHNLEITEVEAESTLFSEILNDSLFKINSSGNTFQNLIYNLENDYSSSEQVVLLVWIRRISNYDLDNKVTIKLGLDDIEFDREHLTNGLSTSIYTPIVLVAKPKDFYNNINITIFVEGITEFKIGGIQLLHKNIGENITYNEDGNIIERITNKGYERYVYNDDKLLSKVIFNDKIIKSYTYDESKNISLSKEENHAKSVKKYSNKVKSNVTYERRENSDKSKVIEKTIEYSNDNRFIKKFKQNSGNETGIEFDKNEKLTIIIDALGREKHFIYNDLEYLEQILLKKGNSIINKIIYDYDSENRIKEIELFNGSIYSLEYDENDNISKISLNNETLSIFEYDDENEEVSVWFGEKAYKNDEGVNVSGSDGWHYKFENGMISEVNKISIFNVVMPLYKYIYNSDYNLEKVLDNTNSNLSDDEKTVIEEYIYDSNGFLKEVIRDNSTINYSNDSEGILTSKEYVINGTQRNTQYVYSGWPKMASIYDFHTNSATKDSYIGTFNNNAILEYGDEKLCPIDHNDNIASQVPSKLGIIPYLSISEANPLTYILEMPNYYPDDSGCVQFWFYPEKNENNEEKYLISLRDINDAGSIEVYLKDNEVYLKLVEVSNVLDEEIIRLKENIKTSVEIKYDSWNFFSFSFLNRCDGQGYPDVGEYHIRVNDKELTFSNNYPDEARYYIPLGPAPKFNIGHNYDGSSVKGCLNAKIGFLSITPRQYLSPTEIDAFYEYTKQYFEQEEGNNYNFSVSNTTFSGSDDSFSVYKLQKTFNSTKNNKSKKFINRSNKEIENTDPFEYDEKNKNYVYVAKGNDLIYDFGQSKSGTIVMKACIDVINEYQYFFEGEDENGNNLSLYRKEDEYLYIKYNNTEIATNLLFTNSEYHTIAFSFNEQIIASSQNQNTKLQVRLKLDDETFNTTISDTYELASFTFSIGKKKTNNMKKMLRNENNTYPLNGKIETIATSVAFCEEDTLNSLISSLDGITTTKTYDELGILQEKTIHHNGNNIISNSYNYYLDENSNVIATVPEFEFIKYKSTDGTDEKMSIIYQYDEIGRLIRYIIAGQVSYDYTYDDNGFISVVEESTNYVDSNFTDITETTYSYDSNGNILRKSTERRNIYSPGSTSETDNYTYEGEKLVSYNTNQIRYDSSKPMFISSYNGVSYTYEADRLKSFIVGGRAYYLHYDDEGRRIKKLNYQNVGSEYFYDGNLLIKEINPEYTLDFLYDEYNDLYGFVKDNSEEYFYIRDYFKNILAITNKSGEIVVKYKYDTFGKFTISGNLATTIGKINPFKYKGYYYDNETGLFMIGHRYYSPELGRFIQPADVSSLNLYSINGLNLYIYANNNPIGIAYSSSGASEIASGGLSINKGFYWPNLDFLGTGFGYIENIFSMIAGAIDGYRKIKHLPKISGLEVASDWLMGIGMFINAGLSVYDNFIYPNNLSLNEKLGNVSGDVAYILVSSGITYGVGYLTTLIPFVGPFISPITALLSGIVLDQIWTGEDILWIKGWSIKVNDKSLEEWFKDVLTEWFGG